MIRRVALLPSIVLGLACGGLPVSLPLELPADRPAEPAAELPPLGEIPEAELALTWLEPEGEGCAWKHATFPGGEPVAVATIPAACPERWSAALGEDRAIVFTEGALWAVSFARGGAVREIPAPPEGPDVVAVTDELPLACATIEATVEELEDGRRKLTAGDRSWEVALDGAVGVELARSWRLGADAKWKEVETAPVLVQDGAEGPRCAELPGFAEVGPVVLHAGDLPAPNGWRPAAEAELAQLSALRAPEEALGWHVSANGAFAAFGADPSTLGAPVAWRPAGKAFEQVTADGAIAVLDRGPWLLVAGATGSTLRDVRAGQQVWSGPGWAAAWPEDTPLPELGAEAPEEEGGEPRGAPARRPRTPSGRPSGARPPGAPQGGGPSGGPSKAKRRPPPEP